MITLKYKNGTDPEVSAVFEELRISETPETNRSEGETLRGVLYDHLLSHRRVFSLEIAKDAPTNDVLWVRDFWTAESKLISDPENPGQFVQVVVPSGPCPISYTEGVLAWPEVLLELKAKYRTV
jgi:hypothetical protein